MKNEERLREIIEKGANVVGATTGAILSLVTGSPEFGVGTTAIGASGAYKRVGAEIADRVLAPREEARVGGVLAQSAELLKWELDRGRSFRDDGFFDMPPGGRSDAEEVLEGVLRKTQTEYEERKLPHLARLWSNACLDDTLSPAKLNYLVKLSAQLTYRQFVIISMVGEMAKADHANIYQLRSQHYENSGLNMLGDTAIILSEVMALHQLNCVSVIAPLGPIQIAPSEMRIATHGATLYNAMELHRLPAKDCREVIELLK